MPGHQDSPRSNHAVMSIPAAEVWQGARIIECVPFHDAGLHFFRFSSCKRYHIGGSELDSLGFAEHGQIRQWIRPRRYGRSRVLAPEHPSNTRKQQVGRIQGDQSRVTPFEKATRTESRRIV